MRLSRWRAVRARRIGGGPPHLLRNLGDRFRCVGASGGRPARCGGSIQPIHVIPGGWRFSKRSCTALHSHARSRHQCPPIRLNSARIRLCLPIAHQHACFGCILRYGCYPSRASQRHVAARLPSLPVACDVVRHYPRDPSTRRAHHTHLPRRPHIPAPFCGTVALNAPHAAVSCGTVALCAPHSAVSCGTAALCAMCCGILWHACFGSPRSLTRQAPSGSPFPRTGEGLGVGSSPYATVTMIRCNPVPPLGTVPCCLVICGAPVPSVARTTSV